MIGQHLIITIRLNNVKKIYIFYLFVQPIRASQMSQMINNKEDKQDFYEQSLRDSNFKSVFAQFDHQSIKNRIANYEVKSSIINIKDLNESKYIKIKKYKQAIYYGQIINGKRHGIGIIFYNNNRIYEGEWEVDLKNGQGYELFSNESVYQGFYVNGKPQGTGRYQWPNGQFYEGQWLNGIKHGTGMWKGAKGDSYVGQWKFGKADGYGVHVWINGDRYEGQFKNSLKHGEGVQKFTSQDIYKGGYFQGKPHGYGEYFWKNGSFYKGNFANGFRQGSGVWKKSTGNSDRYQGQYFKDKKHGYGIFTWFSGNIYKGNYENDEREGYGQMYWTDGSFYKGSWIKGSQNGQGIIFTLDEGVKHGIFKNNNLIQIYEQEQPEIPSIAVKKIKKKRQPRIRSIPNKLNQIEPSSKNNIVKLSANNPNDRRKIILVRNKQISNDKNNLLGINFKKTDKVIDDINNKLQIKRQYVPLSIPHSSVRIHNLDKKRNSSNTGQQTSRKRVYSVIKYMPTINQDRKKTNNLHLDQLNRQNRSIVL